MNPDVGRFFDLSRDLLVIADLDGYFRRVNAAWERTLGYTTVELLGRPFFEFVHPDDQVTTRAEIEKLSRGIETVAFENRYRCRTGSYRWLSWSTPAPRPGEDLLYAVAKDVTEQKEAERQSRELGARLKQALQLSTLGEVAGGMAHEFHQPLTAIGAYAGACLRYLETDRLTREDLAEKLRLISDEAQRAAELLRGIREFVRERRQTSESVDLDAVVEDVIRLKIINRGDECRIGYRPEIPGLFVVAEPVHLVAAFVNLFTNAIEAAQSTGETARITVTSRPVDGDVEISVRDEGPGIPAEERPKVFDQFYTTKSGNVGLGLPMAKTAVETHGGRIWIADGDRGTDVRLRLRRASVGARCCPGGENSDGEPLQASFCSSNSSS